MEKLTDPEYVARLDLDIRRVLDELDSYKALALNKIQYQVGRLELREGDILVLKLLDPKITSTHATFITEQFAEFGRKHRCPVMVLAEGMELSVVRREEAP
jgi:hypothetical protein